jgi:FkbM family methyltransferase
VIDTTITKVPLGACARAEEVIQEEQPTQPTGGSPKRSQLTPAKLLSFDEFGELLKSAENRSRNRIGNLEKLVAAKSVYLFGYGGKGRALAWQIAKNSDTKVIIYDSNPKMMGLAAKEGFATVLSSQELQQGEYGVILGACQAQIEQAAVVPHNHIYYQEAAYLFDAPHHANKAREFTTWIVNNRESLYKTYTSIHAQSRDVFLNVLSFRLSLDPCDLIPCKARNSDMWFDVLERHSSRKYATFLDVGAYDGDTLLQAQRRLLVMRGIAVEANASLFESIGQVAKSYESGVEILPRAAWSHACHLRFSEGIGGMISVSEAEDGELEAAPIDDGINEHVDVIKMDIEGAEMPALKGCLRTLKTGPDLAIAAYHRPEDLVQLPRFLESAGYAMPDFDFHVGHYSDCFDDTIIYFMRRRDFS